VDNASTWPGVVALAITTIGTVLTTIAGLRFAARLTAAEERGAACERERAEVEAHLAECRDDRAALKARLAAVEARLGND
jgi:Na+/glutamate symporter